MGRPNKIKPHTGVTRRDLFKRSGAVAAALVAGPGAALVASAATGPRPTGDLFQHGVASGDPFADNLLLWTRVSPADAAQSVSVEYRIATDPNMRLVVGQGYVATDAGRDYTVKVEVDPSLLRRPTTTNSSRRATRRRSGVPGRCRRRARCASAWRS